MHSRESPHCPEKISALYLDYGKHICLRGNMGAMRKKSSIRILLVDDHPVVREGIRRLLQTQDDILVVGEAGDGEQALELTAQLSPDVVLLDMQLPGMNGDLVAKKLLQNRSSLHIIILSAHSDRTFVAKALELGVAGYLTKDEVPATLIAAVRGVARGEYGWISRRVAAQMSGMLRDLRLDQAHALTPREKEVLRGVLDGKTNKEIGVKLAINEKTVEKHLENVFKKLKVASRVEAAVLAVREGMLQE
jgi:DNA-binding NarL/FixJ family response regulator